MVQSMHSKAANFVVNYDLVEQTDDGSILAEKAPAPQQDEVAKKRAEVSKKLKAAEAQPPEFRRKLCKPR